MAIQKKAKRSSGVSPRHSIALTKGDWLDVMDQDGVWTVARVLNVPSAEEVEVMYDGWPEEYDEIVRVDSDRVAPFHTFTWAVKCWVKYLNWPMWPSVITIRTPGNADGVKNLEQENHLYVDFLEDPNFARRDRCWQKKQKVEMFDDNFDKKRTGTNGAQFERALGCALLSDATTKMPTFVRGTLPTHYENLTTGSVEWMRKSMGKALWYKNFANNKDRHMRTHMYDTNNDDTEDESSAGDDEAVPVANLNLRRPKQRATSGESGVEAPSKKNKRALSVKKTHQSTVKIEPESSAEVEIPHELESMESSDDSESGRERETALKKRRRLQVKTRAAVSPVAGKKQSSSSQDSNVASAMPLHVTVSMDEIIVDDDDDDDDSDSSDAARTKRAKKAVSSPARNPRPSRAKRNVSGAGNFSSTSDAKEISPSSSKSRTTAKKTFRVKRVEPAAQRSKIIDSRSEDDEDESDGSNSYDLGTTSEDKNASPLGSQFGFGSPTATSFLNGKTTVAESGSARSQHRSSVTAQNLSSPRLTKKKIYDKGQTKVGARRSIPPLSRDLSLAASPKAKPTRSTSSDDDDSEEEKGVPKAAAKDVTGDEFKPTKLDSHRSKQEKQKVGESGGIPSHVSSKQPRPSKRPPAPQPLIEQRIALARKELEDFNRQKQRKSEKIAAKKRQTMTSPLPRTRDRSQKKSPVVEPRPHQRNDSDLSFLQEARKGNKSSSMLEGEGASQGRLPATWSELDSVTRNLSHSFLSVDPAYSSDSQDSKSVPSQFDGEGLTPFDEPVDFQSDPKESKRAKSAKVKLRAEAKDSGDAMQQAEDEASEDDSGDEKPREVRRSFCVMRAGLEDVPAVDEGEKVRISKRTVISMPRKCKEPVKGDAITSSKESMLQIEPQPDDVPVAPPPAVVFCSSEGFTMEKWLCKRTLFGSCGNEGA